MKVLPKPPGRPPCQLDAESKSPILFVKNLSPAIRAGAEMDKAIRIKKGAVSFVRVPAHGSEFIAFMMNVTFRKL
jgi:hypothetical protein